MTDLLNYEFLDEDLRDFDRLASILIERQEKEREEKERKEKEKEKKEKNISEENKDISKEEGKKSKLRKYLESIEKKDDTEDDIKNNEDKMTKHKIMYSIKRNFNIREAKEFLKLNKNKIEIDLHGKKLLESMYIIEQQLISLEEKRSDECLKEITLAIVTGVGNHSVGRKPILHPNLTKWLKNKRIYKVDEKSRAGHIFVTIYQDKVWYDE